MITATVTTKAVASSSLGMVLTAALSDVEFILLLFIGIFASVMSYSYDWIHSNKDKFTLKDFADLIKAIFYGIPVMFFVYYSGVNNTGAYINVPVTVWGFIAMLAAGSAVAIVEWVVPLLGKIITRKGDKQ